LSRANRILSRANLATRRSSWSGEPVTDANRDAALSGADITEDEHEVQLNAERPVVTKETVPVERVGLATESVGGEEQVSVKVRKEQIGEPEVDTRRGRER
jgi:stress response protein YsnF